MERGSVIQKLFGISLLLLLSLAVYLFFFLGFTQPVEIQLEKRDTVATLSQRHLGAYHEILPTIQAVENLLKNHGLACPVSFGHYLDDPDKTDVARLRSDGGCLLSTTWSPEGAGKQILSGQIDGGEYVVARFEGSPSIGPFVVYPKVKHFIQSHQIKLRNDVYELYRINGKKLSTEYLFPIEP